MACDINIDDLSDGTALHRYSILGLYVARIFTETEKETIGSQQKHKDLLAPLPTPASREQPVSARACSGGGGEVRRGH